jgi:AAA ATPase-like protein
VVLITGAASGVVLCMKAELRPSPARDSPGAATTRSPHCPGGATRTTVVGVRLIGREAEKQALHEILESVRRGISGALVLRGEPGVGKSALLGYAVEHAGDLQIVRTVAVESEMVLSFAAVHQLLSPLLPGTNRLPEPQRRALNVAFGLVDGSAAGSWSAWPR